VVALLMAMLTGITQALYLAPLALPIVLILYHFVRARKTMIQAVSQMAMDCGWPVGMPRAKANY
jgi:tellurite resistance protein TehA-like permease